MHRASHIARSRRASLPLWLVAIVLTLLPNLANARVVSFVVEQRRPFANGVSFGGAGPYERLDGTAYLSVDPFDPLNAVVVNLDKAPRNDKGLVEFSSPFIILKPVDLNRGNHKLWYGINNRGNMLELQQRSFDPTPLYPFTNDPLKAADIGNNLLLDLGYVFIDTGWQGNVIRSNGRRAASLPTAVQPDGSPIAGLVRVEYQGTGFSLPLSGSAAFESYSAVDTDTRRSVLTVRDSIRTARTAVPPDEWAFGRCPAGRTSLSPGAKDICLFRGFDPTKIYELIYPAGNPIVMGLGYIVTRDIASFLRYDVRDDHGEPNPVAHDVESRVGLRRAYVSGTSSTGMYLRDWLYLGFNEDESHRKVFDAVHITIPGTHRLLANVQFSDPNVYSRQDLWHDFLANSYPPHTFGVMTDPVTGLRDGILKRPATDPFVFQVDTANEFWQMMASLNVVNGHGHPVAIPENVRLYFLSGFSHIGASGLASPAAGPGACQNASHDLRTGFASFGPTLRALAVALDEWADKGVPPPQSNYPTLAQGTLVSVAHAARLFPPIPGVAFPSRINEFERMDFGPAFTSTGGVLKQPPITGTRYAALVPKPDRDGLDIAGIRPMEIRVPIGTNTGWNTQAAGPRSEDLCGLNGSFFPFAATKSERQANGDGRRSLEERYGAHERFVQAVRQGTLQLVKARFLLQNDADAWIHLAEAATVLNRNAAAH
jgi:hypothetical protein